MLFLYVSNYWSTVNILPGVAKHLSEVILLLSKENSNTSPPKSHVNSVLLFFNEFCDLSAVVHSTLREREKNGGFTIVVIAAVR